MFYGALLSMLYVATARVSFVVVGLVAFALGAWFLATHIAHVDARFQDWEHPFNATLYNRQFGGSFQLANGLFAQAAGGLFGQGWGQAILALIPANSTDMIYAVITNELGLFGATAILVAYLLFVYRGLSAAMLATDSFSKLLATGLSFIVAMQVFVIVGGVTAVIPLTGVTLPFVAYGGSSVVMNLVLLALLLLISDRARRPA
jgi:cell division protein FtsW (lipid II flippase)